MVQSTRLEALARQYGCASREDANGRLYSKRNLALREEAGETRLALDTTFVSLKRLFEETDDPAVRALLFEAARPCTHCISDKCTTLLMAEARTLQHEGRKKKVCSMWGQRLDMPFTEENQAAVLAIVERVLQEAAREPSAEARHNEVGYQIVRKEAFYLVGYRLRHSAISPSDEEFVAASLPRMAALRAALGLTEEARLIGATDNFLRGDQYDFLFGFPLPAKPAALPEGTVLRKVRAGEWAVYHSSLNDYPSVWRHFTDKFYALEQRGYDRARLPFEYYDANGAWSEVHIPVDADEPEDAGRVVSLLRAPNYTIAGYEDFGELDHPDYVERGFDPVEKLKECFPDWSVLVLGSIHQLYGKPLRGVRGVAIDDYMEIPEGLQRIAVKGGLWRLTGRRHFTGGREDWNFDAMLDQRAPLNVCQHPRAFIEFRYRARGGYSEFAVPMRPEGETRFTPVDLEPLRLFGKLEDPQNGQTVPDAELATYYDLPENERPGTLVVGYKAATINGIMFYAAPLVKGVPSQKGQFVLEGGRFMKIAEVNADGTPFLTNEPGWDVEWTAQFPSSEHAERFDPSRHCRMVQFDRGRHFELYIPILD